MNAGQSTFALALLVGAALASAPASAAVTYTAVNADLSSAPYAFTVDGGTFTFSSTGDIFNPLAVQTSSTAEVSSFGGFLGIPVEPTSDFINRGTVTFGPGSYASFSSPTEVPYSNGDNFIGLEAIEGGNTFYGFAYTNNASLVSYGFESVAGQAITATTAVPEPSAWLLMMAGIGVLGGMLRLRKRENTAGLGVA
jgi:hypothetical protein